MAGPSRPQHHFELDEDIRPLTGTGSGRAARRRHLGPTSFIQWNVSREKVGALFALMILGAVYMLGKEKGQSLRFGGLTADVDRKPPQVTAPSTPTYQPTGERYDVGTSSTARVGESITSYFFIMTESRNLNHFT